MTSAVDRVRTRLGRGRPQANLSLDDYASFFTYAGSDYPFLRTTMNTLDQERVSWTPEWAAKWSGPVFSLVRFRIAVFSQVRFQWTRMNGAVAGDLFGTPELTPLETPWPGGVTADLLARMEWDVSGAGNAYVRRKGATMHRLFPQWVIIVLGSDEDVANPVMASDTTVAGYLYVPAGGKPQFFSTQQVAHYAPVPDPSAHFLGMSWITPVIRELQGDQAAVEHKYRFFVNAGTPNLALKFDPSISLEAVRGFKELIEEEHTGVAKAWKNLYLGGGADPVPVGMSFKDMDYAVIQGRAESRLAAAAGVHPSVIGFSEGLQGSSLNAGNFSAARRLVSETTLTHLWGNAAASLQPVLDQPRDKAGRKLGNVSLWYDSRIPFLREDAGDVSVIQNREAETIGALIKDGFTPESSVRAVQSHDWSLLVHSGLTSVQLQPPGSGAEPMPGFGTPQIPAANGNGRHG